jgi:predicted nuclease of predicted toxin-antitoxin system
MLILANENVPLSAILALRQAGHDVVWVAETTPGTSDEAVLQAAIAQHRLLLTMDKDFGELVYRSGQAAPGVVLVRPPFGSPDQLSARLCQVFAEPDRLWGSFCVIEGNVQRCRPLPS